MKYKTPVLFFSNMISKTQKIHVAIYYVKVYSNQLSKNNIIHTHKLLKVEKIEVQSICNWYFRNLQSHGFRLIIVQLILVPFIVM